MSRGDAVATYDLSKRYGRETALDGVNLCVPDGAVYGVFASAQHGALGAALYLQRHRVRSAEQRITVVVPSRPAQAGIDPRRLLIDVEDDDNLREITRRNSKTD